ncbi:MAG: hypothetical protein PHF76_11230 [Bacteroidales bacterium]|nr:hypothetical protein [Bacteroidales bacterium]
MTKRIVAGNLPLKICNRFLEKVSIIINLHAGDSNEKNEMVLPESFNVAFRFGKVRNMPKYWDCSVSIQSAQRADGKQLALEYEVIAFGRFLNEDPNDETEDIIPRIHVTASSVLVGMIREHIATVTAGSPIGTYCIPPIQIAARDEVNAKEKNMAGSELKDTRKTAKKIK